MASGGGATGVRPAREPDAEFGRTYPAEFNAIPPPQNGKISGLWGGQSSPRRSLYPSLSRRSAISEESETRTRSIHPSP